MSSLPSLLYDPSRRRRGARRYHHAPGASGHSPLSRVATAAAIAYGTYRLCAWAWNTYVDDEGHDNSNADEEEEEDGDYLLHEWTQGNRAVERDIRREEGFPLERLESEGTDYGERLESDETDYGDRSRADNGNASKASRPRSRRSRDDWSDTQTRSNVPSPPQDYRRDRYDRKREENAAEGDGRVTQGMKQAAAAASTGLGAVVGAGITAGMHAYGRGGARALPDQERRVRMGRCRLETSRAVLDFLPTLKRTVLEETSVVGETAELKTLRKKKREMLERRANGDDGAATNTQNMGCEEDMIREKERHLWNEIKNKSVTRLITTAYAHTLIFLVLTVQVNLLGGRLLREEQEEKEAEMEQQQQLHVSGAERYRTSHQTVLSETYRYLFATGIPALVAAVERAVTGILQEFDVLGDQVSLRDVTTWVGRVRGDIEQRQEDDSGGASPLLQFVIPPEAGTESDGGAKPSADATTDELARYILDETYDLLESPQFATTERQCLDTTFGQLQTKVIGQLFLLQDQVPLANVVTHLQKNAVSTFHKSPAHKEDTNGWNGMLGLTEGPLPTVPNDYVSKLERLEEVMELADVCF